MRVFERVAVYMWLPVIVFCGLELENDEDIPIHLQMATGEEVAVKLESTRTRHPQLLYEAKIYRILHGGCEYSNYS